MKHTASPTKVGNALRLLGGLLLMLGFAAFLFGIGRWGPKNDDDPVPLTDPQPICLGAGVQAAGGRLYVFSEALCAVNVYTEDGDFLFAVRSERNQSGNATAHVIEHVGVFIEGRNHTLYRFDETNGLYGGRAENAPSGLGMMLYAADGTERVYCPGTVLFFTDDGYCYRAWNERLQVSEVYAARYGHPPRLLEDSGDAFPEIYDAAHHFEAAEIAGIAATDRGDCFTFLNGLYRDQDSEWIRLAKTPLLFTFFYAPPLVWFPAFLGSALLYGLARITDALWEKCRLFKASCAYKRK